MNGVKKAPTRARGLRISEQSLYRVDLRLSVVVACRDLSYAVLAGSRGIVAAQARLSSAAVLA